MSRPLPPQRDRFQPEAVILTASSRTYQYQHPTGQLSLKTMANGRAIYTLPDRAGASHLRRIAVDDSGYLILNEHQPYLIEIDSPAPITSFCIFFPEGITAGVLHSLEESADTLLDAPEPHNDAAPGFFETLIPHDDIVTPLMRQISAAYWQGAVEPGWLEERLNMAIAGMLDVQRGIRGQIEKLPAARASTREELFRRLCIARDLIHAAPGEPLTLAEIARAAALSPYHFQRAFKQTFGVTPHEYLTRLRIEQAQVLLRNTDLAVTDICMEVGFSSPGSFSTLFRKITGDSPRAYRQKTA